MSDATTYDDLQVWTDDEEWVIAKDHDDIRAIFTDMKRHTEDVEGFWACPPSKVFTFHDGAPIAKTFAEWAKVRGRGWFACADY